MTWTIEDAEAVKFKREDFDSNKWYVFGEHLLNEDGESAKAETPDEVFVIKRSIEVKPINEGKEVK